MRAGTIIISNVVIFDFLKLPDNSKILSANTTDRGDLRLTIQSDVMPDVINNEIPRVDFCYKELGSSDKIIKLCEITQRIR